MQHSEDSRAVAAYERAEEARYQRQLSDGDAADALLYAARQDAGKAFMKALLAGDERAKCPWAPRRTPRTVVETLDDLMIDATDKVDGVSSVHLACLLARAAAGENIAGEAQALLNQMISDWAAGAIHHDDLGVAA